MHNLTAIIKAVQFIEDNLEKPITVNDVALAVGYSLYHFSRTFNKITGHSPYDYIMRRRLSEAAQELIRHNSKIIDLAFTYQFNNPETFSRAFKKMFKIPPYQLKRSKNQDNIIYRRKLTARYLHHINRGNYLKPKLLELKPFCLVGMVLANKINSQRLIASWKELKRQLLLTDQRIIPERFYSIAFKPMNWETEGFRMLAFEVSNLEQVPPLLVGKTISFSKYAKFIHKGLASELPLTFDYIYQTWFSKSLNQFSAPIAIERFPTDYLEPDNQEAESTILIPLEDNIS